jgi:drug/metabolite transporter (DMT)-like permease
VWGGLATIYVVWGSTYLAIRVMVETMPPGLGGGVRFVLAGALLAGALAARRGRGALAVTPREALAAGVVGTLLCAGGNGIVTVAERDVPSGLAALLVGSIPLWVIVLRAGLGESVGRRAPLGVAAGFAGVALLLLPARPPGGANALGIGLMLVAAFFWACGTVASPRIGLPRDPLVSTTLQMLIGGLVLGCGGLLAGEGSRVDVAAFSANSVLAFAYLVIVGSLIAYSVYAWLLQNVPLQKVATYAYVNPVIAVVLGALVLSEEVTGWTIAGAAVIVTSVAFIVRRQGTEAPARPAGSVAGACPDPHLPSAPVPSAGATRTASSRSGAAARPTSPSSPAGGPTR